MEWNEMEWHEGFAEFPFGNPTSTDPQWSLIHTGEGADHPPSHLYLADTDILGAQKPQPACWT